MTSDKSNRIVETAYRLFRAEGFHAVGIDKIIADAGVAKMTMYRHFRAKDELIVAVLDWRAERFETQLDRLLASAPTVGAKIEAIIGWYERWFARADFHGCAFAHAIAEFGDADHPVFQAAIAQKIAFRRRLCAILSDKVDAQQAAKTAETLAMLFEGATLAAQMGRDEEAIGGLRDGAAALLSQAGITA